jgi:hypothetical protein
MKNALQYSSAVALAALCAGTIASTTVVAQTVLPTRAEAASMTDEQYGRVYTDMDANKDGMISRVEYVNYHGSNYDRWDTPRKGMMTRDQMRARMFEREMRKTDGNPQGNTPLPGTEQKR